MMLYFYKLTLQFVEDLTRLANAWRKVLRDGGRLVFSVPHPLTTADKANDYWATGQYYTEIGKYGMKISMTHRSLREYLMPFIQSNYRLTDIIEPQITKKQATKHNVPQENLRYPRRLNLSFNTS